MNLELNTVEARVLGALLEKEATTPDAYPLSLNAVTTACNQKSNREPIMELSDTAVQAALDALVRMTLVREQGSAGGRVQRFAHRLSNRLRSDFELSAEERAAMCVLLLRGAQTAGEIRTRAARLFAFESIEQVERVLAGLAARADGPYVAELAREPGRRECRFVQLLCKDDLERARTAPAAAATSVLPQDGDSVMDRIAQLEERLAALEAEIAGLKGERNEP